MYTYQMVAIADQNGRTYESKYGTYNKKNGFRFNETILEITKEDGWREIVNILFHEDLWKLYEDPVKMMTLDELEEKLGYKVKIIDKKEPEVENSEKKEKAEKDKKEIDEVCNFLNSFFGTSLDPNDYY